MTEGILNYDCELFMEHRGSFSCNKHVIYVDFQRKLARSAIHTSRVESNSVGFSWFVLGCHGVG